MLRIKRFLLFFCCVTAFFSCRSARKLQNVIVPPDSTVRIPTGSAQADSSAFIREVYAQLGEKKIDFERFSAKIKVDFTASDGKKNEVNAFVRMRKDSAIWISINAALGIEAFRVLITPDSVKVMDKLNKEAKIRSLSFLQEITNIPFDFNTVQNILVGNPVFLDSNIQSYSTTPDQVSLLYIGSWFKNLLTVSNPQFLVLSSKIDDLNTSRNRTCAVTYSNYEVKDGRYFSTFRNLTLAEKKKLDIKLDFKQYSFNEALSFPFNVPKNYSVN